MRNTGLGCAIAAALGSGAFGQAFPPPKPVTDSPAIPQDVSIPDKFPGNPIAFFDDYSWRAFIAVVWPGAKGKRGEPDRSKTVDGAGPRVFETYKALEEVFHDDGSPPSAWDEYDPPRYNPCAIRPSYGDLTLGSFSKFGNLGQAGFGDLVGPLIAQNNNYVRYLTAYNRMMFDDIANNQWYLRSRLPTSPGGITFRDGGLDVKAAWIPIDGVPNPERYYVRSAHVLDPVTGECSEERVGLVGLHIVQKTPTRPQWTWSSFEHVDNVPSRPGERGQFALNDGTGAPMPSSNPYRVDRVLTAPTPRPFNVTRVRPIHPSTRRTNDAYHVALGESSIWRNYQLVMTQWPTTPSSPSLPGTPDNTFPGLPPDDRTAFANTALETFDQPFIFTSCMACHNATKQPTDFVWSLNDHAYPANSMTPNLLMRNEAVRKLRDLLRDRRGPDPGPGHGPGAETR